MKVSELIRCGGTTSATLLPVNGDSQVPNNSLWVDSSDGYKLKWKDNAGVSKEVTLV